MSLEKALVAAKRRLESQTAAVRASEVAFADANRRGLKASAEMLADVLKRQRRMVDATQMIVDELQAGVGQTDVVVEASKPRK